MFWCSKYSCWKVLLYFSILYMFGREKYPPTQPLDNHISSLCTFWHWKFSLAARPFKKFWRLPFVIPNRNWLSWIYSLYLNFNSFLLGKPFHGEVFAKCLYPENFVFTRRVVFLVHGKCFWYGQIRTWELFQKFVVKLISSYWFC